MTISTAYAPTVYNGDGTTLNFPIVWPYQSYTQVVVTSTVVATGVETVLVYGTDYTITPANNSPAGTGAVLPFASPAIGTTLTLTRVVAATQLTHWTPNDPNPSTAIENAVDKLTMIVQGIEENPLNPGGDTSTFVRGDGSLSNTLIGTLGAPVVPSDAQTVMAAGQTGAAAIKVISGASAVGAFRFAEDGSADAWGMQWAYDPDLDVIAWQGYGTAFLGTFGLDGNVAFGGDLAVTGDVTANSFTGSVAASNIDSGTIATARLGSGAASSNTFLRGDQTWAVVSGGGGGINTTTTGTFVIAAVGLTQTVPVTATTGMVVGTDLQISDGTHLIIGLVTAIASLNLTVQTQQIAIGTAGNTMASGAAVQSGNAPGNNTIQVSDLAISPSTTSELHFVGNPADLLEGTPTVDMFIESTSGGTTTVRGYANSNFVIGQIYSQASAHDGIAIKRMAAAAWSRLDMAAQGDVLHGTSSTALGFGKLTAPDSISAATITPALLNCTNPLTNTYLFGYDNGTGHFKMFAPGLVPSGTAAQFINGAGTATDTLAASGGATFTLTNAGSNSITFRSAGATSTGLVTMKSAASGSDPDVTVPILFQEPGYFGTSGAVGAIDMIPAYSTYPVEGLVTQNWMRATVGLRTAAGAWSKTALNSSPPSTLTLDIAASAYQRIDTMAGNCTITITDTAALPSNSSYRFAGELTVEVVAPGSNTITWAAAVGSITWVNGGTAPTMSATGTNVFRFVRRQGVSGWLGYVEVSSSGGTYTDAQARSAVLDSTYLLPGTGITWSIVAGTSATPNIGASAITNAMLAGSIQPSKLQSYPGNSAVFLNGAGGWTTPAGGGGGGVSTGGAYTWTNATGQTWQGFNNFTAMNTLTRTGPSSSTISTKLSGLYTDSGGIIGNDASAIEVVINDTYATPALAGGVAVSYYKHTVTAAVHGAGNTRSDLQLNSTLTDGFNINDAVITMSCRLNGTAAADAVWLNSWGPDSNFAVTPDAQGIVHEFNAGVVRIGECNYGNAWGDFGLVTRGVGTRWVAGLEFFPDWLAGNTGDLTAHHYNASWGVGIGGAGLDSYGVSPKNWIGMAIFANGIVGRDDHAAIIGGGSAGDTVGGGGYAIDIQGGSTAAQAYGKGINLAQRMDVGIDLSGTTITAETTSGHTNQPAIMIASGQAICFKPPTGANTGVYIAFNGTNLRATKDGGNSWTTIV